LKNHVKIINFCLIRCNIFVNRCCNLNFSSWLTLVIKISIVHLKKILHLRKKYSCLIVNTLALLFEGEYPIKLHFLKVLFLWIKLNKQTGIQIISEMSLLSFNQRGAGFVFLDENSWGNERIWFDINVKWGNSWTHPKFWISHTPI
jgi:hypothetical protein